MTKPNRAVRTFASICLIPKIVSELPKAALQNIMDFKEDVHEEMDTRKKQARDFTRNNA